MQSAEQTEGSDRDSEVEREYAAGGSPEHTAANQLEYMADLILELKGMAERARLETLSGILALAHAEARRQRGLLDR
jgi:hypothetical protein